MKTEKKSGTHQKTSITEDRLQQDCAMWFKNTFKELGKLYYMINNSGTKTKLRAAQDKAMGLTAGIPDTHLVVAKGGFHSLYVEFKVGLNVLSPVQKEVIGLLQKFGHKVVVVYSLADFQREILEYLFPYHEARKLQGTDILELQKFELNNKTRYEHESTDNQ